MLKSFAQLLKSECRPGDLVARYGGEEFVVLCADCTNAAAARRAEELRKAISELAAPGNRRQQDHRQFRRYRDSTGRHPGLHAPPGRSRSAGSQAAGPQHGNAARQRHGRRCRWGSRTAVVRPWPGNELFIERLLVSAVPLNMAIEKLRGFVLDHHAEILAINQDRVDLQIEAVSENPKRRPFATVRCRFWWRWHSPKSTCRQPAWMDESPARWLAPTPTCR